MNVHSTGLRPAVRWSYAATGVAATLLMVPLAVYLPKFYTDAVGVPVAWVGTILMVGRVVDAVTDPAMGLLSDRTRTRWGRRRPYVALGSIPLAICFAFLLMPPRQMGTVVATVWFVVAALAFQLLWTVVMIPYEALGVEVSVTYDERTRLMGARDGLALLGVLAAVATPPLVGWIGGEGTTEHTRFFWYALLWSPPMVVCCWLVSVIARERTQAPAAPHLIRPGTVHELRRNKPFRVMLAAYTLAGISAIIQASLLLYFVPYVLGSERAEQFLLLYIVSGLVCVPVWLWIAGRGVEKRTLWITGMAIAGGAHLLVFFLPPGAELAYAILVVLSGLPFSILIIMPAAMQADVIDYGEKLAGVRQEGLYIGVWSVVRKLAAATGLGVSLWVLGAVGYEPDVVQTPLVIDTLRVVYALVPSVFYLFSILILTRYPITRAWHDELLASVRGAGSGDSVQEGDQV